MASPDDRSKWNARFASVPPRFDVHPLVHELSARASGARVLEVACGTSGSALALAQAGATRVTCVDVSDVALAHLADEAARRGLDARVRGVRADLTRAEEAAAALPASAFDVVLATRFWDAGVFVRAALAVAPGGIFAWETFSLAERTYRPQFSEAFCLKAGEPVSLLPAGFTVWRLQDLDDGTSATRRLVAVRS